MKILVIGGAGHIGTAIVEAAARMGHDVYSVTRRHRVWENEHIHAIEGNWMDDNRAIEILDGEMYDVIVDGLLMRLATAKRDLELVKGHCKQFIFISSDGVYNRPAQGVKENAFINLRDLHWDIMYSKREIELYIDKVRNQYPFMITTIRPSVTFGKERIPCSILSRKNQWTLIDRIKKGKPVILADDGGSLHAITPSAVFGEAVVGTFLNEDANGKIFHISDGNGYTWDEVVNCVGKLVDCEPEIVHIPVEWLRQYNTKLYIEIKEDKLDTLTLDISEIKKISPHVKYQMELEEVLKETITYLELNNSNEPVDEIFNLMCDDILIKYAEDGLDSSEREIAQRYVKLLNPEEKKIIKEKARHMRVHDKVSYIKHKIIMVLREILPKWAVVLIKKLRRIVKG